MVKKGQLQISCVEESCVVAEYQLVYKHPVLNIGRGRISANLKLQASLCLQFKMINQMLQLI
jgi:hypothetical protein